MSLHPWEKEGFRCVFYRGNSVPTGVSAFFTARGDAIKLRIKDKDRVLTGSRKQTIYNELHAVATKYGYRFSALWDANRR